MPMRSSSFSLSLCALVSVRNRISPRFSILSFRLSNVVLCMFRAMAVIITV